MIKGVVHMDARGAGNVAEDAAADLARRREAAMSAYYVNRRFVFIKHSVNLITALMNGVNLFSVLLPFLCGKVRVLVCYSDQRSRIDDINHEGDLKVKDNESVVIVNIIGNFHNLMFD
ncbi:hypothetical protein MAR_024621 [Mya arenaria]|uniref:Uncharacterized protein n=1 Tax=Mya arenaria TaxID=6604 RepID=A0ABY7DT46_MYAAR|nr:hypothetical protein MAR_024621 [Mya arenaria]